MERERDDEREGMTKRKKMKNNTKKLKRIAINSIT